MDMVFSLVGSSRTQHISSIGLFYKNKARGGGGLSDCEKLVRVTHRRWLVWICQDNQ